MSAPDRLDAVLDKNSKTFERDVQKFREELKALEKRVAPAALIVGARREGSRLVLTVLPCVKPVAQAEGDELTAWREF